MAGIAGAGALAYSFSRRNRRKTEEKKK